MANDVSKVNSVEWINLFRPGVKYSCIYSDMSIDFNTYTYILNMHFIFNIVW